MTLAPNVLRTPNFLLIQYGVVLTVDSLLGELQHTLQLKQWRGFKIAIGYADKGGKRHIAGIVADVAPLWGTKTWSVSRAGNDANPVSAHASVINYVVHYLNGLLSDGCLYDLYNLSAPLTIKPIYKNRSQVLTDHTAGEPRA